MIKNLTKFVRNYWKPLATVAFLAVVAVILMKLEVDKKAVAILTLILGYITNAFTGLSLLVSMIPWVGPLLVKIFTIPLFWIINAMGHITSAVAIRKGYGREIVHHRIITMVLLVGLVLGYILGHLVPVR